MTEVHELGGYPVELPLKAHRNYEDVATIEAYVGEFPGLLGNSKVDQSIEKLLFEDLVPVPRLDWASAPTLESVDRLEALASAHDASRAKYDRQGERIRNQDLATVQLPNPMTRRQARIRLLRDNLAYHEAAIPVLRLLQADTEAKAGEVGTELLSYVDSLKDSLVALGWPRHFLTPVTIRFNLNDRFRELSAKRESINRDVRELRTFVEGCRLAIIGAQSEIAAIEKKIRTDLAAAAG